MTAVWSMELPATPGITVCGRLLLLVCHVLLLFRFVSASRALVAASFCLILVRMPSLGVGLVALAIITVWIPVSGRVSLQWNSGRGAGIGRRDCGWRFALSSHRLIALPVVLCTTFPSVQLALGFPVHGCLSAMALPSPYAPHLMHQTRSPDSILWWPPLLCTPWSLSAAAAFAHAAAADPPHRLGAISFHFSALTRQHLHCHPPLGLASRA